MISPHESQLEPAQLVTRALAVLKADRLCFLATTDGDQPRLRPVTPVKTEGFIIYLVNLHSHNKTREIANNPRVELCYLDDQYEQVRITGVAEVVNDLALLQDVVGERSLLRAYLESVDRSQFVLYRVRPTLVRYMQEWAREYVTVPMEPPGASA